MTAQDEATGPAGLSDFAGTWHVSRTIEDRAAGRDGRFVGTARFDPDGPGLLYTEEGHLTFPGAQPLLATRRYLWRPDGPGRIAVLFADGRPFHDFGPDQPEARHWCDPDTYDVTYRFARWPEWESVWQVAGPRKSYVMTSHYTRVP